MDKNAKNKQILALSSGVISTTNHLTTVLTQIVKAEDSNQIGAYKLVAELFRSQERIAKLASLEPLSMRTLWTLERSGQFWEMDVPSSSDEFFRENFRITKNAFADLVERLPLLEKQNTNFRLAIPLDKRIAVSLFTLGSSDEYRTIGRLFGISAASICCILQEFCDEVWRVLSPDFLPPNFLTQESVEENIAGFKTLGFPQCYGAIDGCHIKVSPPKSDPADFYNYKGWHSVILLALVDHKYRFKYINVGAPGGCNDSQVYEKSDLKNLIQDSNIFRDMAKEIEGIMVPVNILGDSAFRFSKNLMKPYPFSATAPPRKKAFNYHLSKCQRVVKNAFGQLKARFRRLGKEIEMAEVFTQQNPEFFLEQPEWDMTIGDRRREAEIIREAIALSFDLYSDTEESIEMFEAAPENDFEQIYFNK